MALLSRVAERLYWGARYLERAEDASRVLQSFGDPRQQRHQPVASGSATSPSAPVCV